MNTTQHKPTNISQKMLIEMGWTKDMIAQFLPKPILVANPIYANAPPMKLWSHSLIEEVMKADAFMEAQETENRKRINVHPNNTYEKDLVNHAKQMAKNLDIKRLSDNELRNITIEHRRKWYDYGISAGKATENSFQKAAAKRLDQWIVSYILYHLINFDGVGRYLLFGRVGNGSAYLAFKRAILERIAAVYPMVAEECNRQITELDKIGK